jgi:hypothetical protein
MTTPNIDLLLSDITFRRGWLAKMLEVTVHNGDDTRFDAVSLVDLIIEIRALRKERDEARKDAARVREASPSLHAAASDLRHMANGGSCSTDTLNAHADALLDYARTDTRFDAVNIVDLIDEVRALREERDEAVKRRREIDDEAFDYAEQIETLKTQIAAERAVIEAAKRQADAGRRWETCTCGGRCAHEINYEMACSDTDFAVSTLRALEGDA